MIWTKEQIKDKIKTNQAWLERAIVALFDKQTRDEQATEDTHVNNKIGLNKPDAHKMSYYAKWIMAGKHLNGRFLEDARNRVLKYSKQLTKMANNKI